MEKFGIIFAVMLSIIIAASALGMAFNPALTANVAAQQPPPQSPNPSYNEKAVVLAERNYNYYFPESGSSSITINKGEKVTLDARLSGEGALLGCMKSVRTPWGTKVFKPGDTRFSFTPAEAGTFHFTCGMGMGSGTIVVE